MPFQLRKHIRRVALLACLLGAAGPALAAPNCQTGNFDSWLEGVRQEAAAKGISKAAIAAGLEGVTFDQGVLNRDRGQKVFRQTFEEFSARMIDPRLKRAAAMMRKHAALFQRIEAQYGVPPEILVAIWGLETDFGSYNGSFSTLRALATLAYDCRRSDFFTPHLIGALKLIDAGAITTQTRGAKHGELGHTQFLPGNAYAYGVDGNGDGAVDLYNQADALATTANYLRKKGWKPGKGYAEGEPNFAVIKEWNAAKVYQQAIAIMGAKIDG